MIKSTIKREKVVLEKTASEKWVDDDRGRIHPPPTLRLDVGVFCYEMINLICPCCNKILFLEMVESESKEIKFRLFHYISEPSYEEIQSKGIEFGSTEGGE